MTLMCKQKAYICTHMKKNISLVTLGMSVLLVFSACKKDKVAESSSGSGNQTTEGKNKMEIVMMQDWRWADELDSAENGSQWTSNMLDCNKDDVYSFKAAGVVTINEGADDCDPGVDQVYNSTWSMQNGTSKYIKVHEIQWEILSQTNDEMIFERTYNPGSEDHVIRQYWRKN